MLNFGPSWIGFDLVFKLEPLPMESVLAEIEKALSSRLYHLAVVMTLTMPDICSALESSNGKTSGIKYKAWWQKYLSAEYPALTGADAYSLRCGVIHQGKFGHENLKYDRIIWTFPHPRRITIHKSIMSNTGSLTGIVYQLDASIFCRNVIAAVRAWYQVAQSDPHVKANLPNLIQLYPQGYPPYIIGLPVIA